MVELQTVSEKKTKSEDLQVLIKMLYVYNLSEFMFAVSRCRNLH